MTTKVRRVREQAKRNREAAIADYIDTQRRRRQYERSHGWPLVGILRRVEVFQVGAVKVTREVIGLR